MKQQEASSLYYSFNELDFELEVKISTRLFWIYEEMSTATMKLTNLSCQIGLGFVRDISSDTTYISLKDQAYTLGNADLTEI